MRNKVLFFVVFEVMPDQVAYIVYSQLINPTQMWAKICQYNNGSTSSGSVKDGKL